MMEPDNITVDLTLIDSDQYGPYCMGFGEASVLKATDGHYLWQATHLYPKYQTVLDRYEISGNCSSDPTLDHHVYYYNSEYEPNTKSEFLELKNVISAIYRDDSYHGSYKVK